MKKPNPILREPHASIFQTICKTRKESGITQVQLSQKTGIAQCDISRIENGMANPSVKTLQRLATGMGMTMKLELSKAE